MRFSCCNSLQSILIPVEQSSGSLIGEQYFLGLIIWTGSDLELYYHVIWSCSFSWWKYHVWKGAHRKFCYMKTQKDTFLILYAHICTILWLVYICNNCNVQFYNKVWQVCLTFSLVAQTKYLTPKFKWKKVYLAQSL